MSGDAAPLRPDLCVIGGGSGGLSVAAGAVQMGASVVLVEAGEMGGDCLNTGCVPSKALIAAAAQAQAMRAGAALGIAPAEPQVDPAAVHAHVRRTIAAIAPHDSEARFAGLGVTVIRARARFTGPREIEAGGRRIRARRFVVATGSEPAVPPVPGLDAVPFLATDRLWDAPLLPGHLLVLGAGPIGVELAQAFRRLGAQVTVVEAARPLAREDPALAAVVLGRLAAEGVRVLAGTAAASVAGGPGAIALRLADGTTVEGTHLLVATGRRPRVAGLGLDAAGIDHGPGGIAVDAGLRSVSNARVYAVGDVAGAGQFTHLAGYQAGLVIRSALFRLPARMRLDHIPRVTFTDPELAQVGLTEAEARAAHGPDIAVHLLPFAGNDRARAEGRTEGLLKLVASRRGRILGCGIAGPQAGELIQPWALALSAGLGLRQMAGHVAAYPTLGEISKRAAGAHFAPRLFGSVWVKRIVRLLARLG